jgi:hypothetical protein
VIEAIIADVSTFLGAEAEEMNCPANKATKMATPIQTIGPRRIRLISIGKRPKPHPPLLVRKKI